MKTVIRNSYTPKTGDYCETIVVDKESQDAYIFDCDGIFTPMPQPVDVEDILRRAAEYTDETVAPLEEKLDTIEEGAQVNVIETITQNGQPLTVTDKTVNVTVPTKTSDLENDGSDGTDTYVESSTLDDYYTKSETDTQIGYETDAREIADSGLQEQIDAIVASSDVVDIVGTYAALQNYDTSTLSDNDIIKVLTDETRDDATTYYRWSNSTWTYIGAEGPFYTKAETDAIFTPMSRTINGKALSSDITLTAQDVGALPDSTVIPTVNDATLTIQKNGTTVGTFTANSASNQTANITVPVDTSDLNNDGDGQSPFATEDYVDLNGGKIDTIEVNGTAQPIVNKTVDITVPTKTSDLTNDGDGNSTYVETDDLGAAAFSNQYADLDGLPTIPTVNDATLTIQKNGTDVATFTANSSTNQTANITVPTDTADLTNGAGFITSSALSNYYTKSETYSQGEVNNLINSLSIPTKTSDLTNDSGFITLTDIPTASANDLGLIRIGTGLAIDQDGIVSVTSAGSVDWDDVTNRPTNVSYWTNDAGYITSAAIPTNVSSFTNDAGYITSAAIPTNVSAFTNDAGYLTSSALSNYYTKSETYNQSQVNALINSINIPTKTSDLTNDGADGTSTYVEADDLATVATSGSYNDLSNQPTIPTIVDMTGATSSTAGAHGYVPAPAAGDQNKFLQGDGTWATPADEIYTAGNGIDIDANNEISIDTTVVATQTDLAAKQDTLTAGSNMTISNNVISAKVDSALSASSANPVQNSVVKAALDGKADVSAVNSKVNFKRSYTTAATLNYKKITVVGGTYSTDGAGIILFTREERYIIDGMCASGYGGKCIELGTNHNANNTSATTSNRWVNIKVYGVPESRTTEIYCRMSPYTYVDVHSSGTITITDINEATWTAATNNATYIPLLGTDAALSTTSVAPVQNSVITAALNGKATGSITKANSGTLGTTTINSTTANYMEVTRLSTATDLNTIKTTGIYIITATPTNSPTGAWGTMYVDWTTGTKYQIYINDGVSGNIYKRSWNSSNSTWTSWVRITSADIANIERFYRGLVPLGTAISANKNLNTTEFLKVGKYYCSTNAAVATLTNCPTGTAFMMEVFSPLSTTIDNETTGTWVYRMRLITELNGTMWYQGCNSNGTANNWTYGTWRRVANTGDIGNATLTIQKNGTNVQTFTANATSNKTANITVPTKTSDLTNDGEDGVHGYLSSDDVATVATSGSYNDLTDKPTIPTVNNATLTIQKNGTTVQTFTANASSNKTANIQVPNLQTSNTDPGEGAALAADTFLGVYDVAPSAIDGARITDGTITPAKTTFTTYSTTEKAVGEWIDGKTIYRKTINVGALPNNASKNTPHGISNLDTVIDCRGFAKATWGTQYPIPTVYASGDAGYNTQVSVDNTNVTLSCTGNNSGKSGYVTIWYTKSS